MREASTPNVAILGGGFGGLEAAFYLRMKLGERANITLVSDKDHFLFKPNTIYIPFGLDPDKLKIDLRRPTGRKDIAFVKDKVREVDPDRKTVSTEGRKLLYDYLVVATGSNMRPGEVPGLKENAQTIWTPREMLELRLAFYELLEEAREGEHKRVLFLVAPNNKCAGPLYELVMMLDTVVEREFERRVIAGHTGYAAEAVEDGVVRYANGETLPYDLLITFSPYVSKMAYPTLPGDDRGFIATNPASRQVVGQPDVYAVGDAGDFPVKQAFLAFVQADAAAEHLSARVLGTEPGFSFEATSMCVMEEFDKATFAQVPLRLTGEPERPVEVDPEAIASYKVGTSVPWRLGKKMIGLYLPLRFGWGNPFHAGLPWKGMEAGLKAMSGLMAR